MPPTLKKLEGHIAFGSSVRASITVFMPTVTFEPLKLVLKLYIYIYYIKPTPCPSPLFILIVQYLQCSFNLRGLLVQIRPAPPT